MSIESYRLSKNAACYEKINAVVVATGQVPTCGVRRQSVAATALWMSLDHGGPIKNAEGVRQFQLRATPWEKEPVTIAEL